MSCTPSASSPHQPLACLQRLQLPPQPRHHHLRLLPRLQLALVQPSGRLGFCSEAHVVMQQPVEVRLHLGDLPGAARDLTRCFQHY